MLSSYSPNFWNKKFTKPFPTGFFMHPCFILAEIRNWPN